MATRAVLAWTLVGVLVRAAALVDPPFLHPDGPAYLGIAQRDVTPERWRRALAGYFPPLFPAAIRLAHATGLDWEASGRAVAFVAGVALVPLSARLGTAMLGSDIGHATAALAAVHPHLVRSSVTVLPETLAAVLVVSVALLLLRGGAGATATAGVLAGLAGQVRPELVLLVPLTVVGALALADPRRRRRSTVAAILGAGIVFVPILLVLHAERGAWMLSGKERYFIARKYGTDATSLFDLLVRHPDAFLSTYTTFLRRQIGYTFGAMEWILALAFVVGVAVPPPDARARQARRLSILLLVGVTLAIAINPARRYVVPWLPVYLPWIAQGGRSMLGWARTRSGVAGMLGRQGMFLGAVVLVILVGRGLWPRPSPEACYRSLCEWIEARGLHRAVMMADDSRMAYVCGGSFLLRPHRLRFRGDDALARARERGATILIVPSRERRAGGGPTPAPDVELCPSPKALALYVIAGSDAPPT